MYVYMHLHMHISHHVAYMIHISVYVLTLSRCEHMYTHRDVAEVTVDPQ